MLTESMLTPQLQRALVRYAKRQGLELEDAKEEVQDALLRAWVDREKYDDGRDLETWLRTYVRTEVATRHESMAREQEAMQAFVDSGEARASADVSAEHICLVKDQLVHLEAAIGRLPEAQRQAINAFMAGEEHDRFRLRDARYQLEQWGFEAP